MRWSFLGGVVFKGRYVRQFLMWVDKPLAHYQIVDLEDIVYVFGLLKNSLISDKGN